MRTGWALPPAPRWDITDFGLGDFDRSGLTLVNLALEPEYCEKIMYARRGQVTPCHAHVRKKEDIICRVGELLVRLWPGKPGEASGVGEAEWCVSVDGQRIRVEPGEEIALAAGSRVTLVPGVWHEFYPSSDECVIGEISTANDDQNDNLFLNPGVGRFPGIEEDEPALIKLDNE